MKKTINKRLPRSREAARKAICLDVIAQVKAGRIRAKRGTYVNPDGQNVRDASTCQACAVGSMFVSLCTKVRWVQDNGFASEVFYPLETWFTIQELYDIENAFEARDVNGDSPDTVLTYRAKIGQRAGRDTTRQRRDETTLISIMANIVRNGRFLPEDLRGPLARTPYKYK